MSVQVGRNIWSAPTAGAGFCWRLPGVAPANVVILGGGVVGTNAAKIAVGMAPHVTIIDRSLNRLRGSNDIFNTTVVTLASNSWTTARI